MVGVIDYGAGNLRSVETALDYLGAEFFVTPVPENVNRAERLVFPGVGEAASAMEVLTRTGLGEAITRFYESGKPLLGICLGCQIVLERSEEGGTSCLGLVPGEVKKFPGDMGLKVPHMGWNPVNPTKDHFVWRGIPWGSSFYFVHSYYPETAGKHILAETDYGRPFSSAIRRDNLVATQFHPEKSGEVGLKLLSNFLDWKP